MIKNRHPDLLLVAAPRNHAAFPLPLAEAAWLLATEGIQAKCIDMAFIPSADDPGALSPQILSDHSGFICIYADHDNLAGTQELIKSMRSSQPQSVICVWGSAAFGPGRTQALLEKGATYIIPEPHPFGLPDLVRKQPPDLDFLRSVAYLNSDSSIRHIQREPLQAPVKLNLSFDHGIDPKIYGDRPMPIRLGFGCRYRCAFCVQQPFEGPFRIKELDDVKEQIACIKRDYAISNFIFVDPIINSDPDLLLQLCDLIAPLKIQWEASIAPLARLDSEFFHKLASSGAKHLVFGVESFSDALLEKMNKEYTGAQAIANLKAAADAGISVSMNLIAGFPGEVQSDLVETVRNLRRCIPINATVKGIYPCRIPEGSILQRLSDKYEISFVPGGDPENDWLTNPTQNKSAREKSVKELAIVAAGLPLSIDLDLIISPHDAIRQIEPVIRHRWRITTKGKPDAILINPPPWGPANPPVGLGSLSSYLERRGIEVGVEDVNIRAFERADERQKLLWHVENKSFWSREETFEAIWSMFSEIAESALKRIAELRPAVVGFSVVDPKERFTIRMIRKLKEMLPDTRIIIGGPACFTDEFRRPFENLGPGMIAGICTAEGEEVLYEAVLRAKQNKAWDGIPGLLIPNAEFNREMISAMPIEDLSALVFPTYNDFNLADYKGDELLVEWSRGCLGQCTYCKGRQIAGPYRCKSPNQVVDELTYHVERSGYRRFTVCDSLLNGDPKNLFEICKLLVDRNLTIAWRGEGLPLPSLNAELLKTMRASGCYELQLGLETGSDDVLRRMNKAALFTVEQARDAIRRVHDLGIAVSLFLIVGFPGETESEFLKTLKFLEENRPYIDRIKSINELHIITGTVLHSRPDLFGITLPEADYHCLWTGAGGLNHEVRKERVRRTLKAAFDLGIPVQETNLAEDKSALVAKTIRETKPEERELIRLILDSAHTIQSFDGAAPPSSEDRLSKDPVLTGILSGEEVFCGPEILEIDLTSACNLRCIACWCHSDLARKAGKARSYSGTLQTDLVFSLIDEAAAMGTRHVQISGSGEPFLHKDIFKIISRIKDRGMSCAVITNGTLVDRRATEKLVRLGLDSLTVSIWAGTEKTYMATHPGAAPGTLERIRQSLAALHSEKRRMKAFLPHVKIYHVVHHLNAHEIEPMVQFAIESKADYVEFTPVDLIPGATDELALTAKDRARIARDLAALRKRHDYLELDPVQIGDQDSVPETKEFARFVKTDILAPGFEYKLSDIADFDVLCSRKEWKLEVREDNREGNALIFSYPKKRCIACPLLDQCAIDKETFEICVEFTSLLGYGTFFRRIMKDISINGGYDADVVDIIPCTVGWTYARVLANGKVIPCCKAGDHPLGDLNEKSFYKIWNDAIYGEFRRMALTQKKCHPYFARILCYRACDNLGQNRITAQRLEALSPMAKALMTVSGRNK